MSYAKRGAGMMPVKNDAAMDADEARIAALVAELSGSGVAVLKPNAGVAVSGLAALPLEVSSFAESASMNASDSAPASAAIAATFAPVLTSGFATGGRPLVEAVAWSGSIFWIQFSAGTRLRDVKEELDFLCSESGSSDSTAGQVPCLFEVGVDEASRTLAIRQEASAGGSAAAECLKYLNDSGFISKGKYEDFCAEAAKGAAAKGVAVEGALGAGR